MVPLAENSSLVFWANAEPKYYQVTQPIYSFLHFLRFTTEELSLSILLRLWDPMCDCSMVIWLQSKKILCVWCPHIYITFFEPWLLHTTLSRQLLALTLCEWKEYLGTYLLLATPQQQLEHFSKQNLSVLVGVLMPCPPSDFSTIQLPNAITFLIYTHSISSSVNIYGPLSFSIFFSILQKLINMTKRIYETFWKLSVSFVIYCLQTISWYERTSHFERCTCVRTLQELDKSENLRTCKVGSSAGTNQHSPLIYTG